MPGAYRRGRVASTGVPVARTFSRTQGFAPGERSPRRTCTRASPSPCPNRHPIPPAAPRRALHPTSPLPPTTPTPPGPPPTDAYAVIGRPPARTFRSPRRPAGHVMLSCAPRVPPRRYGVVTRRHIVYATRRWCCSACIVCRAYRVSREEMPCPPRRQRRSDFRLRVPVSRYV